MMGLQSLYYYVSEDYFLAEDLPRVWQEIKKARKEILDEYTDDDFRNIQKQRYVSEDKSGNTTEEINLELSHSKNILSEYLKENRPHLFIELFPNN